MSRPVLAINFTQGDDTHKVIDPQENPNLLHYLRHRKHLPGLSKKQIKHIESIEQHYIILDDKLMYRADLDKPFNTIIPKVEERTAIIKEAHSFGHFKVEATYNRIKQQGITWPRVKADIAKYIAKCHDCLLFDMQAPINSKARALPVTGMFDRVGIDLVFGLPTTKEGYKGIIVFTEYLSKYPFAMPIKSKSAVEIAACFFHYISLFGPPKEDHHGSRQRVYQPDHPQLEREHWHRPQNNLSIQSENQRSNGAHESDFGQSARTDSSQRP